VLVSEWLFSTHTLKLSALVLIDQFGNRSSIMGRDAVGLLTPLKYEEVYARWKGNLIAYFICRISPSIKGSYIFSVRKSEHFVTKMNLPQS
jgi:hypothetical protein